MVVGQARWGPLAIVAAGLVLLGWTGQEKKPVADKKPAATKAAFPGWRLGVQAWSFRKFTFFEALEKSQALGLDCIEAYPGQPLCAEHAGARLHHGMAPELKALVKKKLAATGIKLLNYGVVQLSADEKKCRPVFDFAREMGVETIVSEPPPAAMDLVEKLCKEYGIGMSIHNHPKPSHYWHPATTAAALRGRSPLLGACADTGHWMRAGLKPVECLQILAGRIRSIHIKDRTDFGLKKTHDVIFGSGKADMAAILEALRQQNFQGMFAIEYEYNWLESFPEIKACVEYFNQTARALARPTWQPLLAPDLGNCIFKSGSWTYENGLLTRQGGGDIWTRKRYGNFVLDLEFKLAPKTNSGVFVRTGKLEDWLNTAIEVQVLDSFGKKKAGTHDCAAIFDCLAPTANVVRKPGEWNHYRISAIGPIITVVLNDQPVLRMDLDLWEKPHKNPDGTPNKFKYAYKELLREGHFGFQDHGQPVWYRNIKIIPFD